MTQLFLYLLALVVGFSPAEARHVARPESVAVGQVASGAHQGVARASLAEKAHLHLISPPVFAQNLWTAQPVPPRHAAPRIYLTDRPRA